MMLSRRTLEMVLALSYTVAIVDAEDTFNYRDTSDDDYGPEDWDKVSCDDLESCPGWPDKHLASIGWELEDNMCEWCPLSGNDCPHNHRMSPVDLVRDRAIEDNSNWKECPDWHWMKFEDGSCQWDDMDGLFEISRHALQIHLPIRDDGDIDCSDSNGDRIYPRLDYSKGFPDWWHLDRTDIKVPSEHTQHGQRYAAEVSLSHFYEVDHYKNQIGYVSIFMQDYPGEKPWHYLDKLICEFRREEEKTREECGLPPAPVYKMCELFRGQERSPEDFEFLEDEAATEVPDGQLDPPPPRPLEDFGGDPDSQLFPLQLCQGDCDFSEDCAPGLICHSHEPNEEVPGCIGGADMDGGSDFCIFDPFGGGYIPPTDVPTVSPTLTARPTIEPLPLKPLEDLGGTPPVDKFPLQRCQGDCDTDDDCMEGLICHQRDSNEAVPGCLGGQHEDQMTDYCVLDPHGNGYTDPPSESQTSSPSFLMPPTAVPTTLPQTSVPAADDEPSVSPTIFSRPVGSPKEVLNIGWEPAFLLGECEGDCDDDTDCLPGLVCFERSASAVAVPGCLGGEEDTSLTDYCVYPSEPDDVDGRDDNSTSAPTSVPVQITSAPTVAITTLNPTLLPAATDAVPLNPVSWSPPEADKPLGLCEGDCDDDDNCSEGLVCFQRYLPNTAVPGCIGGETDTSLMDFCIKDPSSANTSPPTNLSTSNAPSAPTTSPPTNLSTSNAPSAPTASPPTDAPSAPNSSPTTNTPSTASGAPSTVVPANETVTPELGGVPPSIDCESYKDQGVNINRICKDDEFMCCQNPRSSSNYCHEVYNILGDEMESACHHCCMEEERGEPLKVGPASDPHPNGLEKYEACDSLSNTGRLCKENSCCDVGYADTDFCNDEWDSHEGDVERICWFCCFPSKSFPEPGRRQLSDNTTFVLGDRLGVTLPNNSQELLSKLEEKTDFSDTFLDAQKEITFASDNVLSLHTAMTKDEMRQFHKNNPPEIKPGDKIFEHPTMKKKLVVRKENYGPKEGMDEDAYFEELHSAFQRRELQTPYMENYEDVFWWPYEWLLKVGTEYYFRYEGSMTVPPCYSVNHWRVMKDPIRVAEHQIKELERLLAWRLNGDCDASTAGNPREDNPDAVDVNRPLQELKEGHRMVFCECQDWPSKFPSEREWCKNWQTRDPELRLFDNPYNWWQNGF